VEEAGGVVGATKEELEVVELDDREVAMADEVDVAIDDDVVELLGPVASPQAVILLESRVIADPAYRLP
jgi:hypothetical protein